MAKYYNVKWFGDDVRKKVMTAQEKAITLGLEFVKQESIKVVPKDTGMLEKSAGVKLVEDGGKKSGYVYYDTPYAIKQHEELGYRHAEGRIAKYLELPLQQNANKALEIMQKVIKGQIK
jgi:hypothetical protein